MAESLLLIVVAILAVGIAGQLLASRLRVPSVVFYLAGGLFLGELGIGLVDVETFGDGLTTVVGLGVAVIVFDGAFVLSFERIKEASTTSGRLVTVGAVVTFLGTAVAARVLLGTDWGLALLIGALLVATGPTVITPIVNTITLREHVSSALETEGIINDVTAAIAAVVIFEVLLRGDGGAWDGLLAFAGTLGVGVLTGLAIAGGVGYVMRAEWLPGESTRAGKFLTLLAAVGAYGVANAVAAEAGVAAAATAGIALANVEIPHREPIETFTEDVTLLLLAFVFVSLAALIDVGTIVALGVDGVVLLVVVALVLRPLVALLATVGVERFTRPERLFLAAIGPRGIIPASVATLFAAELMTAGETEAARTLLGAVFLVIVATDAVEAGFARQIGTRLGVLPMRTIIVGGGRVGRSLAAQLTNEGEFVVIVDDDPEKCRTAREAGFTVFEGDGTDRETLIEAGVENAKAVVAATDSDDVSLLVCQTVLTRFDVERVLARVNQPENVETFRSLGVTAIDSAGSTALALANEIERPSLTHWMTDLSDGHDIIEIEVTSRRLAGKTIREVNDRIPGGCLIAEIGRGSEAHVPDADEVIEYGDTLTFLGDRDAVREAVKRFHPHD